VSKPAASSSSEIKLPAELPSVEEALKVLAAALKAATEPRLDNMEIQRLNVVVHSPRRSRTTTSELNLFASFFTASTLLSNSPAII